jgi:hypothetical protein
VEAAGEAERQPGSAAPGEQAPEGDLLPLGLAAVDHQEQGDRVGGDVRVDPGRRLRVDLQVPVLEGEDVASLSG